MGGRREPVGRPESPHYRLKRKEYAMSVKEDKTFQNDHFVDKKKKRRFLSPEKKFQIFLESQTGKTPVGLRDAPKIIRFYSSVSEYPYSGAICSPL